MKNEIDFFIELLHATGEAYARSDVKRDYPTEHWAYSITATRFLPGKPMIVGFNWGAASGERHGPQDCYPIMSFGNVPKLGSFARTKAYFEKYFPEALEGMMTNYCLFRSKSEGQISQNDLRISRGLFEKIVKKVVPSRLITFSGSLRNYLESTEQVAAIQKVRIQNGRSSLNPVKGQFVTKNGTIPFCYLPHPNTPAKREAREACWEFVFGKH